MTDPRGSAIRWRCSRALGALLHPVGLGAILLAHSVGVGAQEPRRITACIANPLGVPIGSATVAVLGTLLTVRSSTTGCVRVPVTSAREQLRVRRVGYRPLDVDVPSRSTVGGDTLRIVMYPSVTELAPTLVVGDGSAPLVSTISPETLRQLPALGERDVFRALPFVPGVSQPNDVLSRAHLAGGASDEHGIALDGHPLQAPFHLNQVFGAVNPSALDHVDVVIHHIPASRQDRLSGSIDLTSRQLDGTPGREMQISVISAGITVLQPNALGLADVMLSARGSYLDGLLRTLNVADGNGGDDQRVPSFRDALLTIRRAWPTGWRVEALAFHTQDRWFKSSGPSSTVPPRWGESLVGARAAYLHGAWRTDFRVSYDRAFAEARRGQITGDDTSVTVPRPSDIAIDQRWLSAATSLAFQRTTWSILTGLSIDRRDHDNAWSGPDVASLLSPSIPSPATYVAKQSVASAFVEASRALPFATVVVGVRATRVDSSAFVAPRLLLTAPLSRSLDLSLSVNRRLQHEAIASEPLEGSITQPVFFTSTPRVADVAAISSSWRPRRGQGNGRFQATATAYARNQRNSPVVVTEVIAPLSEPPLAISVQSSASEPRFRLTSGFVMGGTVGVDYATEAGWLLQSSYTRQRVRDRRDGSLRPVPWDAPHQLVAIIGVPFAGRFQATVAQQVRSGTAITPIQYRLLRPTPFGNYAWRLIPGVPLSARRPSYLRTDVGIQGAWNALGRRWIASVQVINAFSRTNGLDDTAGSLIACDALNARCENGGARRRSLPLLPSVGLEVRW